MGAHAYDNGQTDEGRAYVYLGSAAGLAATAAWTAESDQAIAYFGVSVATAGDVNGDGYADVIVGATATRQRPGERRPRVRLSRLSRGPGGDGRVDGGERPGTYASFGYSVATAGDVNGDGYADVIVGAPCYDNGQSDEGRAYVYLGSAAGLAATAAWTAESDQACADFGYSVATAGDVNGDGYADVIVGAYDLRQRPDGRRPRVRLPRLGRGPGGDGRVDGGERPGMRLLRRLGRHGRGRQRRRVRGRDRGRGLLRQRPDGRRPRVRLPRLGRGPGGDGRVDGGERPGRRLRSATRSPRPGTSTATGTRT